VPEVREAVVTFNCKKPTNLPLTGRVTCDGTIVNVGAGPVAPEEEEMVALRLMLPVNSLMVLIVTL